jgi:hypothetical protein
MGAKTLAKRNKVKPFIKVGQPLLYPTRLVLLIDLGQQGDQLHASIPYPLCFGAGGSQGDRYVGDIQGAQSARRLQENRQEAIRGAIHIGQESLVLHRVTREYSFPFHVDRGISYVMHTSSSSDLLLYRGAGLVLCLLRQ